MNAPTWDGLAATDAVTAGLYFLENMSRMLTDQPWRTPLGGLLSLRMLDETVGRLASVAPEFMRREGRVLRGLVAAMLQVHSDPESTTLDAAEERLSAAMRALGIDHQGSALATAPALLPALVVGLQDEWQRQHDPCASV